MREGSGAPVLASPGRLGKDNQYGYQELLGIGNADYDKLVATGHFGTEYVPVHTLAASS